MINKLNDFIKRHELITENSTIIVGVSGGPDSLALLHLLIGLKRSFGLKLIVAHVDHMFRGKQSENEMRFVEQHCSSLGIICEATQINVSDYKQKKKISTQVAARECRYRFFSSMMKKYEAQYLALGHHGDDQIETVLMKLVRGSTGLGYAGIPVKRPFSIGHIIRPLLSLSREEIEHYCQSIGLEPRRDPSNDKDDYTRNRIRHRVLPYLKRENERVHERVQQFSEMMIEDQNYLKELTENELNKVMKKKDNTIIISRESYLKLPIPLQRRGIQLILKYLYQEVPPSLSSIHINDFLAALNNNHPSGTLHYPMGLKVVKSYDDIIFTYDERAIKEYNYVHEVPSQIELPNGDLIFSEIIKQLPNGVNGNHSIVLDKNSVELPLVIRTRKPGDKMTLKGTDGTKKIKDIFIDQKIPLYERDEWPVVEDRYGRIIWLPGLKKSSFETELNGNKQYILLQFKKH
ncbi:tRNA lysidine(34) synthetase TilS [Cytobacillus sp. IB215665]|uniref:tRNA lysidine(34) synthetase TilS n=1 Tax=Cytobacillus sp. IB215665 TaxID=3097357 RepID=UPI002A1662B2|nr:tRNA lysidine(34) synthetase TilS [Cytobacillus sp. IB215665]MDX8367643.1 tRNA lysidine(34) synthetase TilS [Cytobacillus sp. IB215665]